MESFEESLPRYQARVASALSKWLPDPAIVPRRLHEAMRYATLNGGKRIRALLVYATGETLGVPCTALDGPACAVELIHAYSLVHDDLPVMDDDDLRRGKPTCHRAYDEATAVLVGDALQSLAFQVLTQDPGIRVSPERRLQMIEKLALASGSQGMAGGQAIDLASVGKPLTLPELENMHIHKTGALIRAAAALGVLSCEHPDKRVAHRLDHYAKCIGLAFQIQDDILDEEGDAATLGKTTGADKAQNKPTYPSLLGLSEAKTQARDLHDAALASIDALEDNGLLLRAIADYIIQRPF